MKLFYANTSPYARKVRVFAAEKGLGGRIEVILCNPFDVPPELKAANPLSKVPSLVLDIVPRELDKAEKKRLRDLSEKIQAHPDRDELLAVMEQYCAWVVDTLSVYERDALRKLEPAERSQKIKELREEQASRRRAWWGGRSRFVRGVTTARPNSGASTFTEPHPGAAGFAGSVATMRWASLPISSVVPSTMWFASGKAKAKASSAADSL